MNQPLDFDPLPKLNQPTEANPENTYLRVLNGARANQQIPVNRLTLMVGRKTLSSPMVDLDLTPYELGEPPMSSRQHAVFEWSDQQLKLCDLDSRNGTTVNGIKLTPKISDQPSAFITLQPGDAIAFGNIEMEVIVRD